MLSDSMRQTVHSKAPRTLPIVSTRVVSNSLRLEYASSQVANCITAKNRCSFARSNTDGLIQVPYDLCVCTRSVTKMPAGTSYLSTHCRSPSSEQLIGRKVVFNEVISPLNRSTHRLYRFIESFGMRRIES